MASATQILDAVLQLVTTNGVTPEELVIDPTQGISRQAFKIDGQMLSFHRGMKLVYRGKVLNAPSCFRLMGWQAVNFPAGVSANSLNSMLGNMVAMPVIGQVFLACLAAIRF